MSIRRQAYLRAKVIDLFEVRLRSCPEARAVFLPFGLHELLRRHQAEVLANGIDGHRLLISTVSRMVTNRTGFVALRFAIRPEAMNDVAEVVLTLEDVGSVSCPAAERR